MEKLRAKADSQKTLADTSKIVRMGMANRGHSLDINDKAVLRGCLDTLQDSISVRSVAGMSERLETIARKMGLKFNHHNTTFYISTETFYVEVRMDGEGAVLETKIHHQSVERSAGSHHLEQAAPEISECLSKGDFAKFTEHLKGLMAVYAIPNCSALDKARAWQALYHLERDLERLGRQGWSQDLGQLIQTGSLGVVQSRAGGIPMRLVYFLPPYELIKPETGSLMPLTSSLLKEGELGFSATLALRPSTEPYLLPLSSLVQGQDWFPLTKSNAVPMPAHPSLSLEKPLPMSWALVAQIASITGVEWLDKAHNSPLLSLITRQASNNALDPANNRGLFVTLPDQQHCYFMTETPALTGQLVSYVPFRHPQQVPAIIEVLRTQAQFNTLISSCVRTNSLEDVDTSVMMEATCLDPLCKALSITFEHPTEEVIATAELDLSNVVAPRCRVYSSSVALCPEETADRVLQASLSIPVTMRTVINRMRGENKNGREDGSTVGVGGHSNGFTGSGDVDGGQDTKMGGLANKFKMSPGRGAPLVGTPAVCDPGGPGGGLKIEPMDTSSTDPSPESLNRDGLQAASLPGARTPPKKASSSCDSTFRHPSNLTTGATEKEKVAGKSENRRRSDSKPELGEGGEVGGLSVSLTRGPLSDNANKPAKKEATLSSLTGSISSKDRGGSSVRPNVSITPISDSSVTIGDTESSKNRGVATTGIEIIPLGAALTTGAGSQLKSKVRDLKRSLSEDDKRRLDKKEKRKREEKARAAHAAGSGEPGRSRLLGVIERLGGGGEQGIEITPASVGKERAVEPNVEISLDRLKNRGEKGDKPKLKLTIKTGTAGAHGHERMVSPNRLDNNFQIPKLKAESPTTNRKERSPSTSPKHSKPSKITERFITDPSRRAEDRKRSSEGSSSLALHIVKSPTTNPSPTTLSPLTEGLLEDTGVLLQWLFNAVSLLHCGQGRASS